MRILRVDPSDAATVRACYEVQTASKQAEDPLGPPKTARVLRTFLAEGWEANPCESWAAFPGAASPRAPQVTTSADDPDGTGVTADGWYWLELPDRENLDRATLIMAVRPGVAGHDARRALLSHAARRARASGRTVLSPLARQGRPLDAFFRSAGARHVLTEARRTLDLRIAPPGHFTALREAAAKHAAGYSLITWRGVTPEQHLDGVARIQNAMNDAPREEGIEDSVWDADRVRERYDSSLLRMGLRGYSVAAVHDATGELTALTQLEVDPDSPEWGHQGITAVTRPHRGHRLGLLVKAAMLEWLAGTEPHLERIETGNADANEHMIAVNEALGFTILDPSWAWLELPVATVLNNTVLDNDGLAAGER
jgi:RimJ/RimL family protein N-acetyltransferase